MGRAMLGNRVLLFWVNLRKMENADPVLVANVKSKTLFGSIWNFFYISREASTAERR